MYRIFPALKDTYITDRVIRGQRQVQANVGTAGSLDLFKLYGVTTSASLSGAVANNELSRILVQFDTSQLATDVAAGKIDPNSSTFKCTLRLYDVFGGQPTPALFTVTVYPLSQSFDEGIGNDVVFYQDQDIANFLTASAPGNVWFLSGANATGTLDSPGIDVITNGDLHDGNGVVDLSSNQLFVVGNEDLTVDVTKVVSATLAGRMTNYGFRVSFTGTQESDTATRFVKRFGSRQAVDPTKRPALIVKYDDSVQDNQSNFFTDVPGQVFMYNKVRGTLSNVVSGTSLTPLTGANCMTMRLEAPISGGFYSASFSVSQYQRGTNFVTGAYVCQFTLFSATPGIQNLLVNSGTINFKQIWCSNDGTVGFLTSSNFAVRPQQGDIDTTLPTNYIVTALNTNTNYKLSDVARIRVNIANADVPYLKLIKIPLNDPSFVIDSTYWQLRDEITQDIIVPFDPVNNSTRLSSDGQSMYFDLYMSSLAVGRTYTIDILILEGTTQKVYRDVCAPFTIDQQS